MRRRLAKIVGAASAWVLERAFHRPAANFPGKAGLAIDPDLIAHLRTRISDGIVVVVGTNGKTTVTNLLACALEASEKTVCCNRTGANLDSGVASALLRTQTVDWGVFESDELWLAAIASQLEPDFIVLLNLFRDQLDRAGEIDHVQQRIVEALALSPASTLLYNADDPFCQAIADRSANAQVAFGISCDMGLAQNRVADSGLCQNCESSLDYAWRQYGQLGSYRCPHCGFARKAPAYQADDVRLDARGISFDVRIAGNVAHIEAPPAGAYMVYNLLATCAAADCCHVPSECVERAVHDFAPQNGRLQTYRIAGRKVLLNLAKNPVGLNQNLRIVADAPDPKAVAIFVNDREADGHDVSWLWDVDFEELADLGDLAVFAGGIRRNDLQVRLKYAGIESQLVDGARDFAVRALAAKPDADLFLIANYTALPNVKAELDQIAGLGRIAGPQAQDSDPAPAVSAASAPAAVQARAAAATAAAAREAAPALAAARAPMTACTLAAAPASARRKLTIVHLYPELLNLYGDGGNVSILADRARRRGIEVEVVRASRGGRVDIAAADIVFLGGGPDREQRAASRSLLELSDALKSYVEDDGVLLAICGGFQIIGHTWLLGDEAVCGLGLVDMTTGRAEGGSHNRLVGDVELESPLATMHVVGYENHAGRTWLGSGCEPFGRIVGKRGTGNNDVDRVDGVRYRNVVGTYLHGPLLAKNPEVADWLLSQALARRAAKQGAPPLALEPLDDSEERAANDFVRRHQTHAR